MSEPLRQYGPFHRLHSPTQTDDDALMQLSSGELWGTNPIGSHRRQVQAYRGPLPIGRPGIEFFTVHRPDISGHPHNVCWTPGPERPELRSSGDFAIIEVEVAKIVLRNGPGEVE